jgi:hypothetical protein
MTQVFNYFFKKYAHTKRSTAQISIWVVSTPSSWDLRTEIERIFEEYEWDLRSKSYSMLIGETIHLWHGCKNHSQNAVGNPGKFLFFEKWVTFLELDIWFSACKHFVMSILCSENMRFWGGRISALGGVWKSQTPLFWCFFGTFFF